jgi:serine protease Do
MKKLALALALIALTSPVRAQDEDDDAPKAAPKKPAVEGRNDALKKAFKGLATKDATFVVKVGGKAFGVILDGKLIVTTSAAVKDQTSVQVRGPAGQGEARVLGVDERDGVALLQCPFDAKGIETASEPRIGAFVITVGVDDVLAAGVVSAKNRKVEPRDLSQANVLMGLLSDGIDGPKRAYPKVLQHDAPMTDETLGTPLVDSTGKLVGINVGTGYRGSSYAIAAADLAAAVEGIRSGKAPAPAEEKTTEKPVEKHTGKPWFGSSVAEAGDGSLVVRELAQGGPAQKAGIKVDDRIYAIDGTKVLTLDDLGDKISVKKPGDKIVISLMREGEKQKITVTLGEK